LREGGNLIKKITGNDNSRCFTCQEKRGGGQRKEREADRKVISGGARASALKNRARKGSGREKVISLISEGRWLTGEKVNALQKKRGNVKVKRNHNLEKKKAMRKLWAHPPCPRLFAQGKGRPGREVWGYREILSTGPTPKW